MIDNLTADEIISWLLTPGLRIALVIAIAFVANRFALVLIKKITGHLVRNRHRDENIDSILDEKRTETLKKAFGSIFSTIIWI